MVEADGRDHADFGSADVRGVEAAAEARLEDGHVDLPFGEFQERRRGDQLEERRGVLHVGGADRFVMRTQAFGEGDDRGVGQRDAVDLDAFADLHQVRARVEARATAVRALDRFDHRGGRALAVGASDVETRLRALGVADPRGEQTHAFHAES